MAVSDSGTAYPAKAFSLRGVAVSVVHKTEGIAGVTRTAIVDIGPVTFLVKDGNRQVSSTTCTFLENVGVKLTDTITLPQGQPLAVLQVTLLLGEPGVVGYLTTLLLGELST